jgi:DNA-directed RNA polymerase subunit RPC12/RpoP
LAINESDNAEQQTLERLRKIHDGLITNVHDALVHSFQHLHEFKRTREISQLKWAVISVVQASELLADALAIRFNCPADKLLKPKKGKAQLEFLPPSLGQNLLELLKACKGNNERPIHALHGFASYIRPELQGISDEELALFEHARALTTVRNELMHRTFVDELNDLGLYSKAALATLLVFETRYLPVEFPEIESSQKLDAQVASLLPWLKGEAHVYFKEAIAYLKALGRQARDDANCPTCGSIFFEHDTCLACRAELVDIECPKCGETWLEEIDTTHFELKCPSCSHDFRV